MDNDEKRRRKRTQALYRKFGTYTPACFRCGYGNPVGLELHEPGGRKFSGLRIIVCCRCHRELSEDQRSHFPSIWTPPDPLERLAHAALGEADMLTRLAEKRREDARFLVEESRKGAVPPGDDDEAGN